MYLDRPAIADGMVHDEQQEVVIAAQPDQQCPDQGALQHIEGRSRLALQPRQNWQWQALCNSLGAAQT